MITTEISRKRIFDFFLCVSLPLLAYLTPQIETRNISLLARSTTYGVILFFLFPYIRKWEKYSNTIMKLVSALFAVFYSLSLTIGYSFSRVQDWSLCFSSLQAIIVWILKMFIYSAIVYFLVLCAFSNIECYCKTRQRGNRILSLSNNKLYLLFVFSRLPYFVVFYPCLFDSDGGASISFFCEDGILNNHHPFFVALLQRGAFSLGAMTGRPEIGMAVFSMLFILFVAAILTYCIRLIERLTHNIELVRFSVLLFLLSPFYALVNIYDTKDGLFTYALFLFVATSLHLFFLKQKDMDFPKIVLLAHALAAVMMSFCRHQGVYFVLIQFFLFVFLFRKYMSKILLMYFPTFILYYLFTYILLPFWGVHPGSKAEVIGNTFQQTALCIIEHKEEIAEKDIEAINGVLNIPKDSFTSLYQYWKSDPIKANYRYTPIKYWEQDCKYTTFDENEERLALNNYFDTWSSLVKRYPITCIKASLQIAYPFFYNRDSQIVYLDDNWQSKAYVNSQCVFSQNLGAMKVVNKVTFLLSKCPVFEFFFAYSYYIWAYIFLLLVLLYRRDISGMICFMSLTLTIAIIPICPTSSWRYAAPITFCLPLVIIYTLTSYEKTIRI